MRIAFDLDGVLADMHGALEREASRLFPTRGARARTGEIVPAAIGNEDVDSGATLRAEAEVDEVPQEPAAAGLELTTRQERQLWRVVGEISNFWESLDEIEPGMVGRLAVLASELKWEVLFITKRPDTAGETAQHQSQRWLKRQGFPLPTVFVVRGSRGKIAAALDLDVVVDDRPDNCLDVVVDSKALAILIWRTDDDAPQKARNLGIGRVASVAACLDLLEQVDRPTPASATMMDRLRSLLGLKTVRPDNGFRRS